MYKRYGNLKKIRRNRYKLRDNIKVNIIEDGYTVGLDPITSALGPLAVLCIHDKELRVL